MRVGIIGFGRLGKLITRYMAHDFELYVYDQINYREEVQKCGARWGTLDDVCSCSVVIPFVPISEFENLILQIKDKLAPGTLIIDVCSVKEHPVQIMERLLPPSVSILATHPMFGPDSAADTLYGLTIVLCKVRIEDDIYKNIKAYLQRHGLRVVEVNPHEHDRQMSLSLLLTHFIGRSLMEFKAEPLLVDTKGYRRLMKILGTVQNDSWQLFVDMNKYNSFAKETRERFMKAMDTVASRIEK